MWLIPLQLSVPPQHSKIHLGAVILSFSGDLDWNKWAADGKLAGGHIGGLAVMGVIDWGRVGGSREEKGVSRKERDGFVSHIIDWSPCWAYCGDPFPVWAGETFTGELVQFSLSSQQLSEASFQLYFACFPARGAKTDVCTRGSNTEEGQRQTVRPPAHIGSQKSWQRLYHQPAAYETSIKTSRHAHKAGSWRFMTSFSSGFTASSISVSLMVCWRRFAQWLLTARASIWWSNWICPPNELVNWFNVGGWFYPKFLYLAGSLA